VGIDIIERFPWREEEEFIGKTIFSLITQYAKFNEMNVVAILLASLREKHKNFVIKMVDSVIEEIIRSLEKNDFKESQRRVALAKFYGECYNYKVIST
jgi:regulator of nonsense transcripts 2